MKLDANTVVYLKDAKILGSESVNMLIRGVVVAAPVAKNHSKSVPSAFLLYFQQLVSTPHHFYALLKL